MGKLKPALAEVACSQLSYLHTTALKLAAYDVIEQMRRRRR